MIHSLMLVALLSLCVLSQPSPVSAMQSPSRIAVNCEAARNLMLGKYVGCVHKARAKLVKGAGQCVGRTAGGEACYRNDDCFGGENRCSRDTAGYDAAVQNCQTKLQSKWQKSADKAVTAGGACPGTAPIADYEAEVDLHAANLGNAAAGDSVHIWRPRKIAFVSTDDEPGAANGFVYPDEACMSAAKAAGLVGNFAAWLSVSDVDAKNRIPDGEYRLVDGTIVAFDKSDLTDGTLRSKLNRDAFGNVVSASVWTGTNNSGNRDGSSYCNNWVSIQSDMSSSVGSTESLTQWSQSSTSSCDNYYRFFCFEQ
jgi:hypothetical protein